MRRLLLVYLFLFLNSLIFTVQIEYININDFFDFQKYTLSNIAINYDGSASLSPELTVVFRSEIPFYCIENFKDGYLLGTQNGKILFVNNKTNYTFYNFNNDNLIISDLLLYKDTLLGLFCFQDTSLFILDYKNNKLTKIPIDSAYAWQILYYENEIYLLCGNPAIVYKYENNSLKPILKLENEKNILKGIILNRKLYLMCDSKILYEYNLNSKELRGFCEFDNIITDFEYFLNNFIVLTSSAESLIQPELIQQNQKKRIINSLYRVSLEGHKNLILESDNFSFVSISVYDNYFYIATDITSGFLKFDSNYKYSFTSLSKGKIIKLENINNNLYLLTSNPYIIYSINNNYSSYGQLISPVYDLKLISSFGKLNTGDQLLPNTFFKIYTRSGNISDQNLWERWKEASPDINSTAGRYLQFRIDLYSSNNYTPYIKNIQIPYYSINLPPELKKIRTQRSRENTIIRWEVNDPNNDILLYTIRLKNEKNNFITLTDKQIIQNPFYQFQTELIPDGRYKVVINVNDSLMNVSNYFNIEEESDWFTIDNTPPEIMIKNINKTKSNYIINFTVIESVSTLSNVLLSIDNSQYFSLNPLDGYLDSKNENFSIVLNITNKFISIKGIDNNNNYSLKNLFLE